MTYLGCAAKWCTPCPNDWREGAPCQETDNIIDQVDRYNRESQIALDLYDIMFPEDYLSALPNEGGEDGAEM